MIDRALLPRIGALFLVLAACNPPADGGPAATDGASSAPAKATAEGSGVTKATNVSGNAATWTGGELSMSDLHEQVGPQLTQMEVEFLTNKWRTETQAAEQLLVEKLVELEAQKQGKDTEALIKAEVEDKVADPTDAEVQAMYAALQRQLRNRPLEEVRDIVVMQARQRKAQDRFVAWTGELREQYGAKVTVPFPDMPRMDVGVDDDPVRGSADAPVTIIQFAEYQCPYCGTANETVLKLLDDYDGKIKVVFRDFPLSFHQQAVPAAVAANCAGEQGKYWEMHDILMGNQRALSESDLVGYAQQVGVDMDKWNTCRQDPAQATEVQGDFLAGQAVGVSGTPAFFINGIMLSGALPYDMFAMIIDKELGEG